MTQKITHPPPSSPPLVLVLVLALLVLALLVLALVLIVLLLLLLVGTHLVAGYFVKNRRRRGLLPSNAWRARAAGEGVGTFQRSQQKFVEGWADGGDVLWLGGDSSDGEGGRKASFNDVVAMMEVAGV